MYYWWCVLSDQMLARGPSQEAGCERAHPETNLSEPGQCTECACSIVGSSITRQRTDYYKYRQNYYACILEHSTVLVNAPFTCTIMMSWGGKVGMH